MLKDHKHTGTDLDIDTLLLFFAPTPPSKLRDTLQFVVRGVAKNDKRPYLNYLYAKDGIVYGSDGHRLHYGSTELENGYYCPKTFERVEVEYVYPDMKSVIPNASEIDAGEFVTSVSEPIIADTNLTKVTLNEGISFNLKYYNDVRHDSNKERLIKDRLYIENDFGMAMVMPLND